MLAACCCLGGVPGFMDVLLYMAAALGVYCVGGLLLKRLKLNSFFLWEVLLQWGWYCLCIRGRWRWG